MNKQDEIWVTPEGAARLKALFESAGTADGRGALATYGAVPEIDAKGVVIGPVLVRLKEPA